MKLDVKFIILGVISAVFTSAFLPSVDHMTISEGIAVGASYGIMAIMGFALGLGRDSDGKRIVEEDFDPEA